MPAKACLAVQKMLFESTKPIRLQWPEFTTKTKEAKTKEAKTPKKEESKHPGKQQMPKRRPIPKLKPQVMQRRIQIPKLKPQVMPGTNDRNLVNRLKQCQY